MTELFDPLTLRSVNSRNRIGVSPMCMYSSENGMPNSWHHVHLGSRAVGGAGLVFTEASAVSPVGRISAQDAGIWSEAHAEAWAPITEFIKSNGAVPGMQLAHAGRKASTKPPWLGGLALSKNDGGWTPIGPSAIKFDTDYTEPTEITIAEIKVTQAEFASAAIHALNAGFQIIEIHAAHGYLAHEFLSPLSNHRTDGYGGSFENRIRFTLESVAQVRAVWPDSLPLAVRLSCSDWIEGGWTIEDSVSLSQRLKGLGVDLIDCSSGGAVPNAKIPVSPGYQVPFAQAIRSQAQIPTAAVGLITNAVQAQEIISSGQSDFVFLARAMLADPYWPLHASRELGVKAALPAPVQYGRAI